MGSPYCLQQDAIRAAVPAGVSPWRSQAAVTMTIPMATPLPWLRENWWYFSRACPKVCPKFRHWRSPVSRSSCSTTLFFNWIQRVIASRRASRSFPPSKREKREHYRGLAFRKRVRFFFRRRPGCGWRSEMRCSMNFPAVWICFLSPRRENGSESPEPRK